MIAPEVAAGGGGDMLLAGVTVACFVLGGFAAVLWSKVDKTDAKVDTLARDLAAFQLHVANTHPTNERLTEVMGNLTNQFTQLFNRLGTMESKLSTWTEDFRDRLDKKANREDTAAHRLPRD